MRKQRLERLEQSPRKETTEETEKVEIDIKKLLRIKRFFFGILTQTLTMISLNFLAPSAAIHFKSYGFSPVFIGFAFAVPAICYALTAPLLYLFTDRLPKRAVMLIGIVLCAIGMFFVGTSKSLGLENNPEMILTGLIILGASWGAMGIPVMPEMQEAVEMSDGPQYDGEELDNFISGLFVLSTGVGESIGPILSSVLYDQFGFREAADIFAFIIIVYGLIYFFFCGNYRMFM